MIEVHTAGHHRGAVAAPHHAAVEAGRAVLAEGGNALEATVTMAASIAAVYPHMAQLGGDGIWLIREPSGNVRALIAAGRAGANARREFYREHEAIPPRGALAALTTPGAVAGWMLALEAAQAWGGQMGIRDLLAPAFAQVFLIDGKPLNSGATLKQTALASTLEHLAHAGLDDFYRGDVGREIAADLERIGSPVTRADLETFRATVDEPLSVATPVGTIYNSPPPTQGIASLIILALFE